MGRFGPQDHLPVSPELLRELCVLAPRDFPGGAGMRFPRPSVLVPRGRVVGERVMKGNPPVPGRSPKPFCGEARSPPVFHRP